jgi:hypothetical protein
MGIPDFQKLDKWEDTDVVTMVHVLYNIYILVR